MIKKIRYMADNLLYQMRYGGKLNIDDFKLKTHNAFSIKKLNIIYLTYFDGPFSINNTLKILEELGNVFKFELDDKMDRKNWYKIKKKRNKKMLDFVEQVIAENKIDVIVCYLSGFSTTPEILKKIQSFNVPMINESLDDERKFKSKRGKDFIHRGVKDICKYFDLSLTTSKSALIKYLVEGANPRYKEYAGNEKIYKNLHLEKKYNICFVGSSYGIRGEYVKFLEQNGIKVYTKGNGWEQGFATDKEMIEIFCKSKIVLGFSTVGENDSIHILKGRDFEVPLTGSFYITGYHDELKEYFSLKEDIETYTTKKDLLEKVKFYLKNEEIREKIALSGYNKCLSEYTSKKSYERLFYHLGLYK